MFYAAGMRFLRLPGKQKALIICLCTAAVMLVAAVLITLNVLAGEKGEEALDDAVSRLAARVDLLINETDMQPLLAYMLSRFCIDSAGVNADKDSIDITFTLPEFDKLTNLDEKGLHSENKFGDLWPADLTKSEKLKKYTEYIADFQTRLKEAGDTAQKREYAISVPADISSFHYKVYWDDKETVGFIEEYAKQFSRELGEQLRIFDIVNAFAEYIMLLTDFDTPSNVSVPPAVQYHLNPVNLSLSGDDWGNIYLETARFDLKTLLEYISALQFDIYNERFLTESIPKEEIEKDIGVQAQLYISLLRDVLYGRTDGSDTDNLPDCELTQELFKLDIDDLPANDNVIYESVFANLTGYLDIYNNIIGALEERTGKIDIHIPEPEPANGVLYGSTSGLRLTVDNTHGFNSYYIIFTALLTGNSGKAADSDTFDSSLYNYTAVYVREGTSQRVYLPAGEYNVKYASGPGDIWYGEEYLFGPDGKYQISLTPITLTNGNYILTLNTQSTQGVEVEAVDVAWNEW